MKFLIGVISLLGAVAYGIEIVAMADTQLFTLPHFKSAFIGFLIGAGFWLLLGRKLGFFSTFEHEFTHLVFSILMFQRPRSFYASERKGHVSCDSGTFVDGLAPYFFPTFSYMLLALYPLLKPSAHPYFHPVLGLLTGYHLVSNLTEFGFRQTDIRKPGIFFSVVFCVFAGILTFGFLMAFVIGGLRGGLDFLLAGWHNAWGVLGYLAGVIRDLIGALLSEAGPA